MADLPGPDDWSTDCDKKILPALLMLPFILIIGLPRILWFMITSKGFALHTEGPDYDAQEETS